MDRDVPRQGASAAQRRSRGVQTSMMIALLITVVYWMFPSLLVFRAVENCAYDLMFDLRTPEPPEDIVLVAIDEASVQSHRLGRFPWRRDVYARLIRQVSQAQVIGLDVLLADPDAEHPEADAELAQAIRTAGNVVLAAHRVAPSLSREVSSTGQGVYPAPDDHAVAPESVEGVELPHTPFLDAAAGVGYVDVWPDSDGVYRRATPFLSMPQEGALRPHFAVELARVYAGTEAADLVSGLPLEVRVTGRRVPLDVRTGSLLINYPCPSGSYVTYSFADVLDGQVPPEEFAGKVVIVGATAPGLYDIRPAPYHAAGRLYMGVETNAAILHSLLSDRPLRRAGGLGWLVLGLLLGTLSGAAVWTGSGSSEERRFEVLGPALGFALVVVAVVVVYPGAFIAWDVHSPAGCYVLTAALCMAFAVADRLWSEASERRFFRYQFSRYASDELVDAVARDPSLVAPGRREITVLFSDIRDFTSLSEHSDPGVLVPQLRQYLTEMNEAVFAHEGWLDKFMGDGLMALYGALGSRGDHAARAVETGLEMLDRLERLNAFWRTRGLPELRVGVGLHTGEAIVGNLGSRRRAQYTAVGDTVNVASRIEAATKEHPHPFLVSEAVAGRVQDRYCLTEIGEVTVRGREQPVRLFAVSRSSAPSGGETPGGSQEGTDAAGQL